MNSEQPRDRFEPNDDLIVLGTTGSLRIDGDTVSVDDETAITDDGHRTI